MWHADNSSLADIVVEHERGLDLGGSDAVAAGVDDVVDAACDPVVPVLVASAAVTGEVVALFRAVIDRRFYRVRKRVSCMPRRKR